MRTIANIRGNLYVGREAAYNSLFLVTPEGIVVADTITAGFSRWLKEELAKRFPGVPVKYVIYSHNHYDHLQPRSLRALQKRFAPLFVTGLGLAPFLHRHGLARVIELDWWQRTEGPGGTRITYVPAQHFSRRGFRDTNRSLWGGFVIEQGGRSIYYAADSAYCPHFSEIGRRFPSIDVALMPIGAYEPRWFMNIVHVNPEESVRAFRELGARHAIAMHFGTFQLTDEGIDEPVEALQRELAKPENAGMDFRVPAHGETIVY